MEYNYQKLSDLNALMPDSNGFKLSIKDYNIDGLNVVIKATYHCHKNRFFNWVLSSPTHGLTLNVSYPKEFSFVRELFLNNERNYNEQYDEKNSIYILKNGEWLLPGEGICMQLLERNFHSELISPEEKSTSENKVVDC